MQAGRALGADFFGVDGGDRPRSGPSAGVFMMRFVDPLRAAGRCAGDRQRSRIRRTKPSSTSWATFFPRAVRWLVLAATPRPRPGRVLIEGDGVGGAISSARSGRT